MDVIFASENSGKIVELTEFFKDTFFNIIPQTARHVSSLPETGLTFIENALIKARHASEATGLPALADDSGLEVEALNGAPGIHSARFAGEKATSKDNIDKLLTMLHSVPSAKRLARFYCVLVFLRHAKDPCPLVSEGTWEGCILETPSGIHGFGYDPVFWDDAENCSAAHLPLIRKNMISHRAIALKKLKEKLLSHRL